MSHEKTFVIESEPVLGAKSPKIHGTAQWPSADQHRQPCCPTVVICHGFKGFMEWGFFPSLADLLVERGFTVVRFNFSGSGMLPGDELVTDLEAFRTNTFSQELIEVLRVLQALGHEVGPDHVDTERIALLGHSRGAGAVLLAAAHPGWRDRVQALVTWAAVSTYDRFGAEAKEAWRRAGVLEIENARTGQKLPLGIELLADLEHRREELDLLAAASQRTAPWLIVHGAGDETVPVTEARDLARVAAGTKELRVVEGGDHTFGARHPFTGPTRELVQVMNATQTWLRHHLCGG